MLARLFGYFMPVDTGPPLRDHRAEARECAEANRQAASQLLQAERDYWSAYYRRATSDDGRAKASYELEQLALFEDCRREKAGG
jgi:hypothetical protein